MPLQEITEAELLAPQGKQSNLQEIPESELLGNTPHNLVEAKELLPIEDLHREIDKGEFSPLEYSAQLNSTGDFDKLSSDQQNRLIDAYKYQTQRGVTPGVAKQAITQIPTVTKGLFSGATGIFKRAADVATGWGKAVAGADPNTVKSAAELASAVESGGFNTLEFARKLGEKGTAIGGAAITGHPEPTEEDHRARFFSDLGLATQRVKVGQGQGALAEKLGIDAESLRKEGIELDPEAIQDMSLLADPTNYIPAIGGFKILSKLGKQIGFVKGAAKVEDAINKIASGISKTAGKAASLPGKAVETIGKAAQSKAAQIAAGTGLTYSVLHGDAEDILKGAATAVLAPFIFKHGGELLEKVGRATAKKSGTLAERVADFTLNHAVKPASEGAIVGGTMAVPLAMLAENDDDAANILSGGATFGAVGHVAHRGVKDAGQAAGNYFAEKYQSLSRRPRVESPGYGTPMDEVHRAAIDQLAEQRPADANAINNMREAFREITLPNGRKIEAEAYLVPKDIKPPELSEEQFAKARPAGFWAGITPEGKARIYLFEDATAVFHEPGHLISHLIKMVDLSTHAALVTKTRQSFPASAREAVRSVYEKRLYGEDRHRLNDDQVIDEIIAESFSNMLRGNSLDGLPAPFRQRIAQTLGGFLEATGLYQPGVKPEGTRTTGPLEVAPGGMSPLGIGHSFNISKLGSDFLARLGVRLPHESLTGARVETPARPEPIRNLTVEPSKPLEPKKPSEDKALKNQPPTLSIEPGESPKWDEAERLVKDPAELETLRSLREAVDKPQGEVGPVRSPYFSVIEDSGQSPVERSARRMQQNIASIREELGAVPTDLREMVFKTTIPNRVIIRKRADGSPNINILGTSVEKIFVNAALAAREAAKAGVSIPIETQNGKIIPSGFRQLFDAITKYTQNQMNGYAGDGSKVVRPENYQSDIPAVNPNYTPKSLEARMSQFVNLLQGIEPPRTTARMDRAKRFNARGEEITTPRNVEAVRLARENARPVLEAVNVRPSGGKRPVFRETGETIKELNPLRDEFAQKGVDLSKILHESAEELSLEHFGGNVEQVQSPLRGVSTPLATAGFMPKPGEHTAIINKMDTVPGQQITDITSKAEGGLTGLAYDIGLTVRDSAGLRRLQTLRDKWLAEGQRLLNEGKVEEALPAIMKAQFFREAYEAATNSGSAAGPGGAKTFRPGVEAPFAKPELSEVAVETAKAVKEALLPLVDSIKEALPARQEAPETIRPKQEGLESFMPKPENPDAVKEAAVRTRGKIFTGFNHADAMEKAHEQGIPRGIDFLDGFVTNKGEFLTRNEAFQRAQEHEQIPKIRPRNSFADLGMLESNEFADQRAFMPSTPSKKLAKSKDLTSKGWILPNDKFVPLGPKLHHDYLSENAASLNKRFKTNFDKDTTPDERIDALNKGFTRINYERNTGTLHVETNKKFWNKKRKDTVFETVADNVDAIDNMLVNVVDDKGKIVDSGYQRLFTFDDKDKLNHLPLISEEGAFMPGKETAPTFYSQVEQVVEKKMPNYTTPDQVRGILSGQNGVKAEELKWLDLESFLKGKERVSKEDLTNYIRQNAVQIEEVVKGASNRDVEVSEWWNEKSPPNRHWDNLTESAKNQVRVEYEQQHPRRLWTQADFDQLERVARETGNWEPFERAQEEFKAQQLGTVGTSATKYAQYTLPGGSNYRELLLTWPQEISVPSVEIIQENPGYWEVKSAVTDVGTNTRGSIFQWEHTGWAEQGKDFPGGGRKFSATFQNDRKNFDTFEEAESWIKDRVAAVTKSLAVSKQAGLFRSGHWDEPNVLAHVRFNERRDVDDKRVLFIEEIQSDWHEKGRKEGYADNVETLQKEYQDELSKVESAGYTIERGEGFSTRKWISDPTGKTVASLDSSDKRTIGTDDPFLQPLVDKWSALLKAHYGVPDAPFRKTWHELAFKRMLRWAAENGFDRLGWTTGEMQAERYDLSKQVSKITFLQNVYNSEGVLVAYGLDGDEVIRESNVPAEKLSDYIGKDATERLLKTGKSEGQGKPMEYELSGEQLKVGGEGMKGFYDKMLVDFANNYGKKWGARVRDVSISSETSENKVFQDASSRRWFIESNDGLMDTDQTYKTRDEALVAAGHTVHGIDITPEMRESVTTKGQPQFMPRLDSKAREDRSLKQAERYFSIGHESPGSKVWIYDRANRSINAMGQEDTSLSEGNLTHGMMFGHEVADRTFKGWYDPEKNIITVVFPDSELRKLGRDWATEEDLPEGVYKALKSKFGFDRGTKLDVFPKDLERATDADLESFYEFMPVLSDTEVRPAQRPNTKNLFSVNVKPRVKRNEEEKSYAE